MKGYNKGGGGIVQSGFVGVNDCSPRKCFENAMTFQHFGRMLDAFISQTEVGHENTVKTLGN